jgi:uncharacterized protein YdhG (YjbR/CyaY superfamily)
MRRYMERKKQIFKSIDDYISSFPEPVQKKLTEIRKAIKEEVPEAVEKISYSMPAFALNGTLVYFAAHSKHIGFYPTASGIKAFANEISRYKSSKGAIQFPLDEPLPIGLIKKIARFRVEENRKKK